MTHFVAEAGPLLWPTMILAAATLWLSAGYPRTGRAPEAWTAACLGAATLLMAGVALVTGFQMSVGASAGLAEAERRGLLVLLGLAESLSALVVALLACAAAALVVAYGAWRREASPAGA